MGAKKFPRTLIKELSRKTVKRARSYSGDTSTSRNQDLIDSITKDDFDRYEVWRHKWGTSGRPKEMMLEKMIEVGESEVLVKLATLRVHDLYEHQKVLGVIRNRWINLSKHNKSKINGDAELFWSRMAESILARSKTRVTCAEWLNEGGKGRLIDHLKSLYDKQDGRCAISNETMELAVKNAGKNENKCSPDRINSNKGYEPGNIQLTMWWVNSMKSNYSTQSFNKKIRILSAALTLKCRQRSKGIS